MDLGLISQLTLETERLYLRPVKLKDAEALYHNCMCSDNVSRHMSWSTSTCVADTTMLVATWLDRSLQQSAFYWVVVLKETSMPIGYVNIYDISIPDNRCMLAYAIGEQYWNRGLTTEVVKQLIIKLFSKIDIHRIQAKHDSLHPASGEVMQKAGMQYEGLLRGFNRRKDGTYADMKMYAILNEPRATPIK